SANDEFNIRPKTDDDQTMGRMDNTDTVVKRNGIGRGQVIKAAVDWKQYLEYFEKVSRNELVASMSNTLLQQKPAFGTDLITYYADSSSRESFIRSATFQIMSTPEYQLC
ncbi:MAG TPA: hypothetical protein VNS32_16350, partial [Flavisolibacter sp.]|nr:hypothetical protein [Flavisolibacter sp.]